MCTAQFSREIHTITPICKAQFSDMYVTILLFGNAKQNVLDCAFLQCKKEKVGLCELHTQVH